MPIALPARLALTLLAPVVLLGAPSCTRSLIETPLVTDYDAADMDSDLEYWASLQGRSAVSNDEGLHGLLLLADGVDIAPRGYEDRLRTLKERGWIAESFDEPSNMALRRGVLAKALAHALEIDGGVMMRLTDKAPRYATRELVYLGIMPDGTDNQVVSGADFVGVISRAQDFVLLRELARQAASEDGAAAPGESGS